MKKKKYIEGKYFTPSSHNKFTNNILDVKIAETKLINESDIDDFVKKTNNEYMNKNVTSNKSKHVEDEKEPNELSENLKHY